MMCCVKFKPVLQTPGASLFALFQNIWNDALDLILPVSLPALAMWPVGQKRSPGKRCLTAAEIPKACLSLCGLPLKPLWCSAACAHFLLFPSVFVPLLRAAWLCVHWEVHACSQVVSMTQGSFINNTWKFVFLLQTNRSMLFWFPIWLILIITNTYYLSDTVLDTSKNINSLLLKITLHAD